MRNFGRLMAGSAFIVATLAGVPAAAQSTTEENEELGNEEGRTQQDGAAPGSNAGTTPSDETPLQEDLDPANAGEDDTILVTGSRIPQPQFSGIIPGVQVTREQIQSRAFTSTLEVLNDQPLVGPGANPLGNNGGQPSSLGASFVDLLDLGTQRTLTLVNGRRYVSGNSASLFVQGNATGSQVDLNSIPTALIDRLDVLTVGGAVAYGSDAVAGVVNAILRDDFDGIEASALSTISEQGDAHSYRFTGIAGTNFAGDRGNVVLSGEYVHDDPIQGNARRELVFNAIAPTFFANGGIRNPNFAPGLTIDVAGQNNGAFLRASDDLIPNNVSLPGLSGGSILVSPGGTVFAGVGAFATGPQNRIGTPVPTAANPRPGPLVVQAGNVQLVPGAPVGVGNGCNVANVTTFCNFAPNALPGAAGSPQQAAFVNAVIARFAPATAGGTAAQRNTLALNLLQANLPTPREFLARNPNTNIDAFIGTFIPNFLDVPNTDPNSRGVLPLLAQPLRFDDNGNVVPFVTARGLTANTPGTTGGAPGGDFFNPAEFSVLRVGQDRYIGNLIAHYDLTDSIRLYTENQIARVENYANSNQASANSIASATTENAALILSINNPFLDAADRAALIAAGVPANGNFVLSTTNQGLFGANPFEVNSTTYRTVLGVKGDVGLFSREFNYDASFTYGRSELDGGNTNIRDVEYALAIDAVRNPANGQIVCASQLQAPGTVALPPGIAGTELVRERNADGLIVERLVTRTVTQDQVARCAPLNPFGVGQASQAASDYVRADTSFSNLSEQYFGQASFGGSIIDLPGGPLGFSVVGEYRRESLDFRVDDVSGSGGTRTAALAETRGYIEAYEVGAEARIPIFGEDFNFPLLENLELTPGIRFVKYSGNAPDVQLLNGDLLTQEQSGDWETIYSIAGTYRPIPDITFRGNYTRSIRQPSIVELFLGGQPAFTGVTDPCSTGNIGGGQRPAVRRANCEAAVIAAGLAADQPSAAAFLNSFVPSGATISGAFTGSPGLNPERGTSYTVGGVLAPRFIPGLRISADYINVKVEDQIIPTSIVTALQVCFDSPNFPDPSSEVGVNICDFFNRRGAGERAFEVDNGFTSGFINLGALQVKAVNMNAQYDQDLNQIFGGGDIGRVELAANAYHLIDFLNAPDGNLANGQQTAGRATDRPEWEVQLRGRYELGGFYAQWVWNYQNETRLLIAGAPGTIETQDVLTFDDYGLHDATIGYSFGEDRTFGIQLAVRNVFDQRFLGNFAINSNPNVNTQLDLLGRRYTVSARVKF